MPNPPVASWRSPIARGMSGPDVAAWQSVLAQEGFLFAGDVDGSFGPKTEKSTVSFQIAHHLAADGLVGSACRNVIGAAPPAPLATTGIFDARWRFLQAASYTRVPSSTPRTVTLIVLHSMEAPDRPDTAEGVASWFAGARGAPPKASAHICCDMNSIVQCVLPQDIAWGAQGGNSIGYHCEQAGYAAWTRDQWLAPNSLSMLKLMASHVRLALDHFMLSDAVLVDDEVAACVRDSLIKQGKMVGSLSGTIGGICEHRQLTRVWQAWAHYGIPNPKVGPKPWWPSHTDCGEGYPIDVLLENVKVAA